MTTVKLLKTDSFSPLLDAEVDPVEGLFVTKPFGQGPHFNDIILF